MIKLFDILFESELPKNKWVMLDKSETGEYKGEIFDLIQNAYAKIGGHIKYKSPDDVTGAESRSDYEVIDLDDDDEIDAVTISRPTPFGGKSVGMGHDGSQKAKHEIIKHKVYQLNNGFYIEVSGVLKDILLKKGVPMITDKETIEKVLKGKNITMNDDGTYDREISGQLHTKTLLGDLK